jgi:hypothetical protein
LSTVRKTNKFSRLPQPTQSPTDLVKVDVVTGNIGVGSFKSKSDRRGKSSRFSVKREGFSVEGTSGAAKCVCFREQAYEAALKGELDESSASRVS